MRILIVGGGIAGLATARALRLRGLDSEIVERDAAPRIAGAGMYLPGNGVAAMRRLGLADEVLAHGDVVGRRRLHDHRGRRVIDFDEAGLWKDVAPPVALHRRELYEILADGASDVPVRADMTVSAVEDPGSVVRVTLSDGSVGEYDLLIGADGVHSTIRRLVFGGPPAVLAGQVGWRYVLEGHPEIDGWNAWLSRDRAVLALAIGGDRVYCYLDTRSRDTADPTGGDPTRLASMFEDFAPPVPALIAEMPLDDVWFSPIEEVAPTFTKGRVVLVGDAAHASSPNMAEGASLALEDALVLADLLAAGERDVPAALAAFRARREPRVSYVQATTHRRDHLRYQPPLLREVTMRLIGHRVFRRHYAPLLAPP